MATAAALGFLVLWAGVAWPQSPSVAVDSESLQSQVPVLLPDGAEYKTWEPREFHFTKTLYVDQRHLNASDDGPGTRELPLKTINRAAQLLQPGERVVVYSGVYREWVRPARGGNAPEHIVSYEAAPGACVVVTGAEVLRATWEESQPWVPDPPPGSQPGPGPHKIHMVHVPRGLFAGYNPFAVCNYAQVDEITYWNLPELFGKPVARLFLQVRGLVFQDGRRLSQVSRYSELVEKEGVFWAEANGLVLHVRPYGDIDPDRAQWEITSREQVFAPEQLHLGYIRLKGLTLECAGNGFPFPQRGAVSAMHGHHWILEDNTIRGANGVGVDLGFQGGLYVRPRPPELSGHHIVRRNTITDCGISGVCGPVQFGTLIENNYFSSNCWHDAEELGECAAIKTHQNQGVLVRGNVILDTMHGVGIYLDYANANCRITRNVVANTGSFHGPGPGIGGIYVEASQEPNWIDHNIVWNSTRANGIYGFFCSNLTVAHNLVGHCAGAGIMLLDLPGRPPGNPGGGNRVLNNLLVDNGWHLTLRTHGNESDHNLTGHAQQCDPWRMGEPEERVELEEWRRTWALDLHSGSTDIKIAFDPKTLELKWSDSSDSPSCPRLRNMSVDFRATPRAGTGAFPGPFEALSGKAGALIADPRGG